MSTLTNSMVRGFGFTLGKAAANKTLNSFSSKQDDQKIVWENQGWEDGDVDVLFEHTKKNDPYRGVTLFFTIILCLIPYVGVITCLFLIKHTFFKKFKVFYFQFNNNTFTYSDKRFKNGKREEERLVREVTKVDEDPTVNYIKMRLIWLGLFILNIIMINL